MADKQSKQDAKKDNNDSVLYNPDEYPDNAINDTWFPPFWLYGILIIIIIMLIAITSVKVINFEKERVRLEEAHLKLEEKIDLYDELLKELPKLEQEKKNRTVALADLTGRCNAKEATHETLAIKLTIEEKRLESNIAKSNKLKSRLEVAREELSAINTTARNNQEKLSHLKQQVSDSQVLKESLIERVDFLRVEKSKRLAELAGIKEMIKGKQEVLEAMSNDHGIFGSLAENFEVLLTKFAILKDNITQTNSDFKSNITDITGLAKDYKESIKETANASRLSVAASKSIESSSIDVSDSASMIASTNKITVKELSRLNQVLIDAGEKVSSLNTIIENITLKVNNDIEQLTISGSNLKELAGALTESNALIAEEFKTFKDYVNSFASAVQGVDNEKNRMGRIINDLSKVELMLQKNNNIIADLKKSTGKVDNIAKDFDTSLKKVSNTLEEYTNFNTQLFDIVKVSKRNSGELTHAANMQSNLVTEMREQQVDFQSNEQQQIQNFKNILKELRETVKDIALIKDDIQKMHTDSETPNKQVAASDNVREGE